MTDDSRRARRSTRDGIDDPSRPAAVADQDPDGPSDRPPPDAEQDEDAPYKRRVAIVLAVLAVLGAWIGILHTNAATNESNVARETTRTAVSAQASTVVEQTVLRLIDQVDLEADTLGLRPTYTVDTSLRGPGHAGDRGVRRRHRRRRRLPHRLRGPQHRAPRRGEPALLRDRRDHRRGQPRVRRSVGRCEPCA
jgi:hypothetical protein